MSTLDELLKEYQKWNSLPSSQVDIRKFNKIKELIGEAAATAEVSKKYGSSTLKYVSVPERSEGTPILDLVFELDTGEMVLVEAKFGTSLLGRTNDRRVFLVDPGKLKPENLKPLPLQRQVEQLEVQWTKDRIAEIKKTEPELATKLENIKNQNKLHILEVRTKVEIAKGKPPELSSQINDHTEKFRNAAKTGRRSTEDPLRELERGTARREALSDMYLKAAKAKATENAKVVADAKKKVEKAANNVGRAKKELQEAKKTRERERRRYRNGRRPWPMQSKLNARRRQSLKRLRMFSRSLRRLRSFTRNRKILILLRGRPRRRGKESAPGLSCAAITRQQRPHLLAKSRAHRPQRRPTQQLQNRPRRSKIPLQPRGGWGARSPATEPSPIDRWGVRSPATELSPID